MGLKIVLFAVACVTLIGLIKQYSSTLAIVAEISLVAIIVLSVIPEIKDIILLIDGFSQISELPQSALKILFKAFGILSVGAIASDVCRDNGEGAVAGVVELCVKLLAIACAIPVFTAVIEIATSFLNR